MKIRFNCGVRLQCEHEITKVKLMRILHYLNNLGWQIYVGTRVVSILQDGWGLCSGHILEYDWFIFWTIFKIFLLGKSFYIITCQTEWEGVHSQHNGCTVELPTTSCFAAKHNNLPARHDQANKNAKALQFCIMQVFRLYWPNLKSIRWNL